MRRIFLKLWLFFAFGFTVVLFNSCNNENRDSTNNENEYFGCINIIHSSPTNTILPDSEMDVIKYLFTRNQLDYTKYQFIWFQKDELGYQHIQCFQFANDLRVFTSDATFHFDKNDNYSSLSGHLVNTINLNTKSSMTQNYVVGKFINEIKQDGFYAKNTEIISGCFDIEFGYYDLSYVGENFVKAWKVKPTNMDYPIAYINDENSEIIGYDNGIRF